MNHIVLRSQPEIAPKETDTVLPARIHRGGSILVSSQLTVGVEPRLQFSWTVIPRYWLRGFSLLVFRSATGFSPEKYPDDLNKHGQLIVETRHDGSHDECPAEGTHYFTLLVHKKILLGLSEKMSILRFSETVPSAKVAIGRIRDQIELREMLEEHEIGKIEYEAKLDEARIRRIRSRRSLEEIENPAPRKTRNEDDGLIAEELKNIDAMVEAMFAKRQKVSELKKDERFRKLSRQERQAVLERIAERLDAAEISARREMRGG
jgi:hypothetical protein